MDLQGSETQSKYKLIKTNLWNYMDLQGSETLMSHILHMSFLEPYVFTRE